MNLTEILEGANVALGVLQARLVLLLCMVLTFVLFAWAMWLGTQLGLIIAATWAALVFLPVLIAGRGGTHGVQKAAHDDQAQSLPG